MKPPFDNGGICVFSTRIRVFSPSDIFNVFHNNTTQMVASSTIRSLLEHYEFQRQAYMLGEYNETQL